MSAKEGLKIVYHCKKVKWERESADDINYLREKSDNSCLPEKRDSALTSDKKSLDETPQEEEGAKK